MGDNLSNKKHIVTVVNSITETSMPYNEFVCCRNSIDPFYEQSVVVCSNNIPGTIEIPDGIRVYLVGRNPFKIRKIMHNIQRDCYQRQAKLIIHLHQPVSAALFWVGTSFGNYRRNTVFTVHSLFYAYSIGNRIMSSLSILMAAKVTCVSQAAYEAMPAWLRRIKKDDIRVIQNGVDLGRIDKAVKPNEEADDTNRRLIYVARMIPIKNHRFLIEVFSELSNGKLILVGAQDRNGEIRQMIESCQLGDRVEFTGLIPRDEVYRRLMEGDIYVSPSTIEGLPVSLLEAMYAGLPAIVSDIQPHLEISGQCPSVLSLPFNKGQWIDALNYYLAMDSNKLKQIGLGARQCAREKFSLGAMLKRYDSIYEEL